MTVLTLPRHRSASLDSAIADALEALEDEHDAECVVCGGPTHAVAYGDGSSAQICTECGSVLEDAA